MSKTPVEVVRGARDLLRQHGWCRGIGVDRQGRMCIEGAVMEATHKGLATFYECITPPAGHSWDAESEEVRQEVRTALKTLIGTCQPYLVNWNDHPSRTYREVDAMLARCEAALIEREMIEFAEVTRHAHCDLTYRNLADDEHEAELVDARWDYAHGHELEAA